jgi:antitoxin VapB
MALNIKNPEVERLAADVAALTGESKTEAIRKALEERKSRLSLSVAESRREHLWRFLEEEIWPSIPKEQLGRTLTREEEDDILGYGPNGV